MRLYDVDGSAQTLVDSNINKTEDAYDKFSDFKL